MDKATEEKINRLSMLEQNSNQLSVQRQSFQNQLIEAESALEEIKTTGEAYKIVGNIMVKADKAVLEKDLKSKKQLLESRIKSLEKQESSVKEKAKALQKEIMEELESAKNSKK